MLTDIIVVFTSKGISQVNLPVDGKVADPPPVDSPQSTSNEKALFVSLP
jgi:hypothetical protein